MGAWAGRIGAVAGLLGALLVGTVATSPPAAAAPPTPTPARTGVPANIYAIGDSITTATGTGQLGAEQKQNSWVTGTHSTVQSMRHRLGISTANAVNLASNGRRMRDFDDQANQLPPSAQYVVVELGGNDLCRPSVAEMTSVADYRAEFRAGLQAVAARTPEALIFVASIPDIYNLWYLRGAPSSINPHVADQTDQADAARFFWDNPIATIPCESLLDNPTSTAASDVARRDQVRLRNLELNQVLAEECFAVLRCRFDGYSFFDRSSNRVSPPGGALLPRDQWWFEDRDISHNDSSFLGGLCPITFTYDGCGDHFHPSLSGQAKLAQGGHEASYQFGDTTAPTATLTPARPPDGNGLYRTGVNVVPGGSDANGLRGQEVRIHHPDGSVSPWTPHLGVAPAVPVTETGTTYVELRSLDVNGNRSASVIQPITIDPSQFGLLGGQLTDPNGVVAGGKVRIWQASTATLVGVLTTGPGGGWGAYLPVGDYKLQYYDPSGARLSEWHLDQPSHAAATPVTVPGEQTTIVNASLALTPGAIIGIVRGPGGPLIGAEVRVHAAGAPGVVATATTGESGGYGAVLAPGSYKLEIVDPSGGHVTEWHLDQPDHASATPVTVVRNQFQRIDATLAPA